MEDERESSAENRLKALGITLPLPWRDDINRVRAVTSGNLVFMSGHAPLSPDTVPLMVGKLGRELDIEEGKKAARLTGLALLGTLRGHLGTLNRVRRVVKVLGFINCSPGFNKTSLVLNGFSDLMVEVFGERGRHARSAIGIAELWADLPIEVEAIFEIEP